ncbi:MAG: RDD family protein [Verrucomicrobia bacterium]|nr:RDD family protein [Verrucomicrobiota bacterium]
MSLRLLALAWPRLGNGAAGTVHLVPSLPLPDVFSWPVGLVVVLVCLLAGVTCSRALDGTRAVFARSAPATLLTGIGLVAGTLLLCIFLLLTGVGIIGLPVVVGIATAFMVVGNAAIFRFIGQRLAPGLSAHPRGDLLTILLGALVCWVLYCIPLIGWLVGGLVSTAGLGAFALYLLDSVDPSRRLRHRLQRYYPKPIRRLPVTKPDATRRAEAAPLDPVTLAIPRATFWPRLLANLIDFAVVYSLLSFLGITRVLLPAWVFYRFTMYVSRSATLGNIALGLDVIKADGSFLTGDFSTSLVRALASLLSLLPFGLGFVWILIDPEKNAWHDRISRTFVVQIQLPPKPRTPRLPVQARAGNAYPAAGNG